MIFFDHTYTYDNHFQFLKKLEKCGFKLSKEEVEHPGKVFCRFIRLSGNTPRGLQYLEFVHIGKGGEKCAVPGVSFGYRKGLKNYYNKLKKKFEVTYAHKNFDWKKDNKSILPGWNFVNFKKLKFRGFFPWITEYERIVHNKKKIIHPNGVHRLASLHFEVNDKGLDFFEKLLGKKINDCVMLSCETEFYFTKRRSNKLKVIHLECKSLNKLKNKFPYDQEVVFLGKDAVLIKNPNKMWDIIISQNG